jgi:hypothetical protein
MSYLINEKAINFNNVNAYICGNVYSLLLATENIDLRNQYKLEKCILKDKKTFASPIKVRFPLSIAKTF